MRIGVLALWVTCLPVVLQASEPAWVEVRSSHFTVISDTSERRARDVALRFEQMRLIFQRTFPGAKLDSGLPLTVMAFRNKKGISQVVPLFNGKPIDVAGLYQRGPFDSFVALDMSSSEPLRAVYHEYAHALLGNAMGNLPVWFNEGFAEFFAATEIGDKLYRVGAVPETVPLVLEGSRFMPMEQLLAIERRSRDYNEGDRRSVFYAQSWLFVHYLWLNNERRPQLLSYLDLRSREVPIVDAAQQAFGATPQQLDDAVSRYYRTGKASIYTFDLPTGANAIEMQVRPLPAIEARAQIALMQSNNRDLWSRARPELERILQEQPQNLAALRGSAFIYLGENDQARAIEYLRQVVALKPERADIYFTTAALLNQASDAKKTEVQGEIRSALERAVELDPGLADAHALLGQIRLNSDEYNSAIGSLQQAVQLSNREDYRLGLAIAYLRAGREKSAEPILRELRSSNEDRIAEQARQILTGLDRSNRSSSQ